MVTSLLGNRVETYFNNGSGSLSAASIATVGNEPSDIAVADFDGDGHLDAVVTNQRSNTVTVLFNGGFNGQFDAARTRSYPAGTAPTSVRAIDLNVDGLVDLVVTNGSESNLAVLLNLGNGVFQSPQNHGVAVFRVGLAWSVAAADFDLDGDLDLVVAKGDANQATVLTNTLTEGAYRIILTGDGDETVSNLDFIVTEPQTEPAPLDVTLPNGGGAYELLIDADDLVLRVVGGAELQRQTNSLVTVLTVNGSASADVVTVLNSGTAVSVPIVFNGGAGDD